MPTIPELVNLFTALNPRTAGCVLAVARKGKILHQSGHGMANIRKGIPNSPDTVFRIGSISKQFTAFTIFMLEDQGHLKLTEDVRKYVPELPKYSRPILIRHLIHHTSGLRSYEYLFAMACRRPISQTTEETMAMVCRQKELNFMPGTEHSYSNTGYLLMAKIVEKVTGRKFADVIEKDLFLPLGMTHSHARINHGKLIPKLACGYGTFGQMAFLPYFSEKIHEGGREDGNLLGSGEIYSTVGDLLLWNHNLNTGKIGGKRVLEAMHQPCRLNDGTEINYCGGLVKAVVNRIPTFSHGGNVMGFEANLIRVPSLEFDLVCLANTLDGAVINQDSIAQTVLKHFNIAREKVSSRKKTSAVPPGLAGMDLAPYSGVFGQSDPGGELVSLSPADGKLSANMGGYTIEMIPIARHRFNGLGDYADCEFRFRFDGLGKPVAFKEYWKSYRKFGKEYGVVHLNGDTSDLGTFAGRYHSKELLAVERFIVHGNALWLMPQWSRLRRLLKILLALGGDRTGSLAHRLTKRLVPLPVNILKMTRVERDVFHKSPRQAGILTHGRRSGIGLRHELSGCISSGKLGTGPKDGVRQGRLKKGNPRP